MAETTQKVLNLWVTQLVPSLLPFMLLTNLFSPFLSNLLLNKSTKSNFILHKIFGLSPYGIYIFIIGQTSGYPMGAKLTAEAYSQNHISKSEAQYLLTICNQSSPAFLEFYVGSFALQNNISIASLFIIFYSSVFMTLFITKKIYKPIPLSNFATIHSNTTQNFFQQLDTCILNSSRTMIRIGGYILFFALIIDFMSPLRYINPNIYYLATSVFELTNGLSILKNHFIKSASYQYLVLGLTAFGGFCTMAQIKGMLIGTFLSVKPYLIGKIIYTIIVLMIYQLFSYIHIFFCI